MLYVRGGGIKQRNLEEVKYSNLFMGVNANRHTHNIILSESIPAKVIGTSRTGN